MALYPCAYSMTFNVSGNTLNGILNQRSQDMLTANGWNVMQYAVLLHMVAQVSGLEAGELVHVIADAHIYDRHVDAVREIITRQPYDAPRFSPGPRCHRFLRLHPGQRAPGGVSGPPCAGNDPGGGLRGGAQYGSHCGSGPELGHREGRRAASLSLPGPEALQGPDPGPRGHSGPQDPLYLSRRTPPEGTAQPDPVHHAGLRPGGR